MGVRRVGDRLLGRPFEVDKALADDDYIPRRRALLEKYNLRCWTLSCHLTGQAVCDHPIDERHRGILPARIWGDGEPEGVRQRAAQEIKDTARAAAAFGVDTVVGFTGSSIWHTVAMFPPVPPEMIERGYADFAERWNPILDVFDEVGVRFAHEVPPSEIAYDYWTTVRTLEAIGHREAFGLNFDSSHFVWQDLDPVGFLWDFRDRIYHVDCKESSSGSTGATAASAPICRGGTRAAAGTSSPPGTGTSPGRRASGCSTRSGTAGRSRWSGRTPAWTARPVPRTPCSSSAHSRRSSRRPSPSTRRSPPVTDDRIAPAEA